MTDTRPETPPRWGGPARLPLALSGLLTIVVVALLVLVFIGSGLEDPRSARAGPDAGDATAQTADAAPPELEPSGAGDGAPAAPPVASRPANPAVAAGPDSLADATPEPADETIPDAPREATPAPREAAPDEATAPPASAGGGEAASPAAPGATPPPPAPPPAAAPPQVAAVPPMPAARPAGRPGGLAPAPDLGLVEQTAAGPLPRIGDDGRRPWKVYARPFDSRDTRPRIAIILSGLGLSSGATEAAIQGLPSGVTLAFQPFADNLQHWIRLARAAGHEVLLNLPMEPVDFPASDPGPQALFVSATPAENLANLEWALSRVSGYVGLVNHMGSRFTTSRQALAPVMQVLRERGLAFVDARVSARSVATVLATEQGVPRAINDRFLDAREVSRTTIDARLAELEGIAEETGVSVGIGQAFPVTIERIREWAASLNGKGIVLAPVSAVVNLQADR